MKYAEKSFSVTVGGKAYRDGWERVFGKAKAAKSEFAKLLDGGMGDRELRAIESGAWMVDGKAKPKKKQKGGADGV